VIESSPGESSALANLKTGNCAIAMESQGEEQQQEEDEKEACMRIVHESS
jgi:hypothetical protein